jgi:alkanesulfonate monooxygenase SsuD/methylene tetrahydromethanopterin reductase-like flavin-dependent oxidoreductase (luciferase family)
VERVCDVVYGRHVKFGFVVPWGDADDVGDLAAAAEEAGWDGLFVWEPVWGVDAWISLGLAAVRTSKIRLGTLLTPPSRRRPWELASQVATVDRLSNGRVTLSVGLGALDSGFDAFGEECDRKIRAELMDECLDVACGLWAGQPFTYDGSHYTVRPTEFPTIGHTIQQPRVPIWCVAAVGRDRSIKRALTWCSTVQVAPANPTSTKWLRCAHSSTTTRVSTAAPSTSSSKAPCPNTRQPRTPMRVRRGGSNRCGTR